MRLREALLKIWILALLAWPLMVKIAIAQDLNPAALGHTHLSQIKWVDNPNGTKQAIISGDPKKDGLYVMLLKWGPNMGSHPHWHPNDRFITVLSGTWWVATGTKYDPASMVPMSVGSVVTHFGKQVHYDGSRDGEVVLEIVGIGPDTATPAEEK